jgi:hypothetical protein
MNNIHKLQKLHFIYLYPYKTAKFRISFTTNNIKTALH